MDTDMDSYCRTCLSKRQEMVSLESPLPRLLDPKKTHLQCLRSATQLEVPIKGEGQYPVKICLRCSKALQVAYHFIKMTQDSEEVILRRVREQAQLKDEHMELEEQYYPDDDIDQGEILMKADEKARSLQCTHFSSQFNKFIAAYNAPTTKTDNCQEANEFKVFTTKDEFIAEPDTAATAAAQEYVDPQYNEIEIDIIYGNPMEYQEEYLQQGKLYTENDIKYENDVIIAQEVLVECTSNNDVCKPNDTNLSAAEKNYIEEIKENLTNGARVFERNKAQTLKAGEILEQTLKTKDAHPVNKNELECAKCCERFTDMHTFIRHRNRHNGITPFRCTVCNFCTCYVESMLKHYKREHDMEPSNEVLQTRIDPFTSPLEKAYYEVTHKCIDCQFETHIESDIQVHVINEHLVTGDLDSYIIKAFNCPDCHHTFNDQKSMHTHFTSMHGTANIIRKQPAETFKCEHCDKNFQSKANLSSHQRACLRHEANCCNICNLKFTSMRKFERHMRSEHAVTTNHECDVCGKTFNNLESLNLHSKRHSERHFQCDHCTRNYVNKSELNIHIRRMHDTVPKALCRICGVTFTEKGWLREHEMKEHSNKSFKCSFCEYQSNTRAGLRLHELVHTGKPYTCEICSKEFSLRAVLV